MDTIDTINKFILNLAFVLGGVSIALQNTLSSRVFYIITFILLAFLVTLVEYNFMKSRLGIERIRGKIEGRMDTVKNIINKSNKGKEKKKK